MCDDVEVIDDYIEYEMTKDCDSVEETFIYEEEEVENEGGGADVTEEVMVVGQLVEGADDIIIKPETIIMEVIDEDVDENVIHYYNEDSADALVEEITDETLPIDMGFVKEEEEFEQKPNVEDLRVIPEKQNNATKATTRKHKSTTSSKTLTTDTVADATDGEQIKGPKRYMLFDELIANIVDYDNDETPIVEFSLSNHDSDEKLPVECGICPDVMHRSSLSAHLKTHLLPGTNRYACIYCDKAYKDHSYLAGHARRHMGIRPYVCEQCKLYFSTKQDLRVHNQRRHQEKEHVCELCGKTFAQNTMLKRHRESTHEKMRRFQCDHCPKAYYKNFSLQEHIRSVHMGNRRMLVCPFCGMQCRDAHKMARHRKTLHLNQKYFHCEICQEEFTNISYFDAHKRSIQCRNNTQRKIEEENVLAEQQEGAGEQQQEQEIEPKQEIEEIVLEQHLLVVDEQSQECVQLQQQPQQIHAIVDLADEKQLHHFVTRPRRQQQTAAKRQHKRLQQKQYRQQQQQQQQQLDADHAYEIIVNDS